MSTTLAATCPVTIATFPSKRIDVLVESLENGDVGLTPAFAHRLKAVASTGALELVQQCGHQPRAGGAERMSERDGPAVDVDFGEVRSGFFLPREHHRGKGLESSR